MNINYKANFCKLNLFCPSFVYVCFVTKLKIMYVHVYVFNVIEWYETEQFYSKYLIIYSPVYSDFPRGSLRFTLRK